MRIFLCVRLIFQSGLLTVEEGLLQGFILMHYKERNNSSRQIKYYLKWKSDGRDEKEDHACIMKCDFFPVSTHIDVLSPCLHIMEDPFPYTFLVFL